MSLSDTFISRPVGTTLLTLALALGGILAGRQLPVSALPEVDFPTLVVATALPGASAETMATTVTTPLERQLGQVPSLRQMTSVSSFAVSQITLQFELGRSLDGAEQDVQAALNAAGSLLPATLPAPPTYTKSNPADAPILTLSVRAPKRPITEVHDFADSVMAQQVSRLSGVGLVTLAGSQKPAVRVAVQPEALAAHGLTLEDVRTALRTANVNGPKGAIEGLHQAWSVASDDQLHAPADFRPLVIAYRDGSALRLADVAQVTQGAENEELAAWADQNRAILLQVHRQPGANVVEVAERVRGLLPELRRLAPAGVHIDVMADRTLTTLAALEDVGWTLALTVGLVVGVMLLFLQSGRATLIPAVTVPLSLLGTLVVMHAFGFSLDNLSLMALTVSTGLVVDDAIVMVENIARHIELGKTPLQAARVGAQEMSFTILSLTVSLVAVLLPLLLMAGVIGKLFFAFSTTLAGAILVSAVLSLTLTPMMAACLLLPQGAREKAHWARWVETALHHIQTAYSRGLGWVLAHQRLTLAFSWGTLLLTAALAYAIPKGFFPEADTGLLSGVTEAAPDISFAAMAEAQAHAARAIAQDPEVAHVASFIGSDGINPTLHTGRLSITLVPHGARRTSLQALLERLQERAASRAGMTVSLTAVQDLQLDSRPGRTRYQYTLEGPDAAALAAWGERVRAAMARAPGLVDVVSDAPAPVRGLRVHIDRDAATRLGVSVQGIDDVLYDALGQRFVSTIYTELNQYRVILEVAEPFRRAADAMAQLYVPSALGAPVALLNVARLEEDTTALVVSHQGQFPAVTVSFNLKPGTSLSGAMAAAERAVHSVAFPKGISGHFVGTAQAFAEALADEPPLILAALGVVYVILGVLYESAIHPITILSTLPSAGLGALVALWLCGCPFDMMALIGIVLLIGIVKKNAIMMIDVALTLQHGSGLMPTEAIARACLLRFRPIMMTTCAALLGALPLALGLGVGAELRAPLGISIVGGLVVSQALTLFTTPVIYLAMGRLASRWAPGPRA